RAQLPVCLLARTCPAHMAGEGLAGCRTGIRRSWAVRAYRLSAVQSANTGRALRLTPLTGVGARTLLPLRHYPLRKTSVGRVRAAGRARARGAIASARHRIAGNDPVYRAGVGQR